MIPVKIVSKDPLNKVKLIVIYLGNTCNFDCVYCDRGYIKNLGGQNLGHKQVDQLKEFFEWVAGQPNTLEIVSFHGGEPLLYIKRMEEICSTD